MEGKPDFGATTAINLVWEKAKKKITPKVLWTAIGVLVAVLVAVITAWVTTQSNIHQLQDAVVESKKSVAEAHQEHTQDSALLHKIDTQLAVMKSQLDTIALEVDRQREWRERIEDVAESPPHARRRK